MEETKTNFISLQEGMIFSTFIDYNRLFDQYTRQYGLKYVVKSTKFFSNDRKFVDKTYNPDILYSEYHMRCKAVSFDKEKKVEVDIQCPSEIKMVPRNQNQVLMLKVFNQTHNHPVKTVAGDDNDLARMEIVQKILGELLPALMAMDDEQFGQSLNILKKMIDPNSANEGDSFSENAASAEAILNDKSSANSSLSSETAKSGNGSKSFDEMEKQKFLHLLDEGDSEDNSSINNSLTAEPKKLGNDKNVANKNDQGIHRISEKKNEINAQGEAEAKNNSTSLKSIDRPNDSKNSDADVKKSRNASMNKRDSSSEPPRKIITKLSLHEKYNGNSSSSNQKRVLSNQEQSNNSKSPSQTDITSNIRITRSRNQVCKPNASKNDEIPSSAHCATGKNKDLFDEDLVQQHSNKQIIFKNLSYSEKLRMMLAWLGTTKRAIENIEKKEYILTDKDIRKNNKSFSVTTLFNGIASEYLTILEKYVTSDVYEIILASVAVNEKNLLCRTCASPASKSGKIVCEKCLKWYHIKCVGIKRSLKNDWCCNQCK